MPVKICTKNEVDDALTTFFNSFKDPSKKIDDIQRKKIVLLLDYDGTLSPIVPHPSQAKMDECTKRDVSFLAKHPKVEVALISGREMKDLMSVSNFDSESTKHLTFCGNHGLSYIFGELTPGYVGSDDVSENSEFDDSFWEKIGDVKKEWQTHIDGMASNESIWVEDKGAILCLHYRNADESLLKESKIIEKCEEVIKKHDLKVGQGHCVLECRHTLKRDKGYACCKILNRLFGSSDVWKRDCYVLYIGDDVTDDDAIDALNKEKESSNVLTFRIFEGGSSERQPSTKEKSSNADIILNAQSNVKHIISHVRGVVESIDN